MKETEQIRKAEKKDIDAAAAIYAHIHEQERTGKATIGWLPGHLSRSRNGGSGAGAGKRLHGAADGHEREKCGGAPIISKAGLCRTGYRALHI